MRNESTLEDAIKSAAVSGKPVVFEYDGISIAVPPGAEFRVLSSKWRQRHYMRSCVEDVHVQTFRGRPGRMHVAGNWPVDFAIKIARRKAAQLGTSLWFDFLEVEVVVAANSNVTQLVRNWKNARRAIEEAKRRSPAYIAREAKMAALLAAHRMFLADHIPTLPAAISGGERTLMTWIGRFAMLCQMVGDFSFDWSDIVSQLVAAGYVNRPKVTEEQMRATSQAFAVQTVAGVIECLRTTAHSVHQRTIGLVEEYFERFGNS